MSFTGRYELESLENFEEFMKTLGVSDNIIEKRRDIRIVTEMYQNDNFRLTKNFPEKTWINTFTIGKECELENWIGEKFKTTVTLDGGILKIQFPKYLYTAQVDGDKLIEVTSTEGPKGTVTSRKISNRVQE